MSIDNRKGNWLEDFSGTLLITEGAAPLTKEVPSERFVERVNGLAYNGSQDLTLQKYLEEVFRGRTILSPHRYFFPYANRIKRGLGLDAWHVVEKEEIQGADVSKARSDSLHGLKEFFLNEQEADDLSVVADKFNILGCSGILYIDRLAAFSKMGRARNLLNQAVFRDDLEETGLEWKYATGKYFKARYPDVPLIDREDCKLSAVVMTGVADRVSLVHDGINIHTPWDELRALQLEVPQYLKVNLETMSYGRISEVVR